MGFVNSEESISNRPASVKIVAAITAVEALAVLAYAIGYLASIGSEGVVNLAGRIFMVVLCVLLGIWQASVAVNFYRGRAYTRAPIIVWQLFQLILSFSFMAAPYTAVAIIAIVLAAAGVLMLFAPRTTAFLGDRPAR